ncbi:GNAT family N-acetyltransferase [Lentzea flaviverrucosa]|uniref:Predicted acetyltransferase n=1 Tax=Lentzea flaviverrucosa TaxID=200379 RepID=A0A1H9XCH8_9PSEU|nr:GNAT family N-acetyltransferase [Lentzea flaviverrucosa]RDI21610.1 putative acetyltransferase [Lentzea flaviverrucosa]SES43741.1 Predicted acetyltransferase [Lentzea flaviverrucosa]
MTEIRVLTDEAQYRAHNTLFRRAMHWGPPTDEQWPATLPSYEPGRVLAAFEGDEMVGTTQSFACAMVVPGGAVVPHAAVSRVGVRPDYTRRGVLSGLMREQLSTLSEPVATLRASEGRIYGRFGYGLAGRVRFLRIDARKAVIPGSPAGQVRMVDPDTSDELLPELHARFGLDRPGQISRWPGWWARALDRKTEAENRVMVVHSGPDGDDGYVCYKVSEDKDFKHHMEVQDFAWANADAWRDLWIYLTRLDLVDTIEVDAALDDPLHWLFEDPRVVYTKDVYDQIWLRLVDVPRMLAARTYGTAGPVVIEVRDRLLPANDGCYRVSPDGAERVEAKPDITIPVDLLGAVYLGDTKFSDLAAARRIEGSRFAEADALFAGPVAPLCSTFF